MCYPNCKRADEKGSNTKTYENITGHKCIIPNSMYPELNILTNNKEIILKELKPILKKDWSIWAESQNGNKIPCPTLSSMNYNEVMKHINKRKEKLNLKTKIWKLYGIIHEGIPLKDNIKFCPKTFEMIKQIPGVINATFSCLEPGTKTRLHQDEDDRFYRVHIPLIIPEGNVAFMVFDNKGNKKVKDWKQNSGEHFIFNDTCLHMAYNFTDKLRVVLLLDLKVR